MNSGGCVVVVIVTLWYTVPKVRGEVEKVEVEVEVEIVLVTVVICMSISSQHASACCRRASSSSRLEVCTRKAARSGLHQAPQKVLCNRVWQVQLALNGITYHCHQLRLPQMSHLGYEQWVTRDMWSMIGSMTSARSSKVVATSTCPGQSGKKKQNWLKWYSGVLAQSM